MGHITHQSQRDENAEMHACFARNTKTYTRPSSDFYAEPNDVEEYQQNRVCNLVRVSAAQDRCSVCGKTFTY